MNITQNLSIEVILYHRKSETENYILFLHSHHTYGRIYGKVYPHQSLCGGTVLKYGAESRTNNV